MKTHRFQHTVETAAAATDAAATAESAVWRASRRRCAVSAASSEKVGRTGATKAHAGGVLEGDMCALRFRSLHNRTQETSTAHLPAMLRASQTIASPSSPLTATRFFTFFFYCWHLRVTCCNFNPSKCVAENWGNSREHVESGLQTFFSTNIQSWSKILPLKLLQILKSIYSLFMKYENIYSPKCSTIIQEYPPDARMGKCGGLFIYLFFIY